MNKAELNAIIKLTIERYIEDTIGTTLTAYVTKAIEDTVKKQADSMIAENQLREKVMVITNKIILDQKESLNNPEFLEDRVYRIMDERIEALSGQILEKYEDELADRVRARIEKAIMAAFEKELKGATR